MNPFSTGKWYRNAPLFAMLPAFLVLIIFQMGPSIMTSVLSFTDISGIPGKPWSFIGIANYKEFLMFQNSRDLLDAIKRTVEFAVFVPLFQNIGALMMAIILNKKIKGQLFYRSVIFLPVVLGVTLCGLAWVMVLNPVDGPVQALLHILGTRSMFMTSYEHAFLWIIFIQIWMNMGYSMVIYITGLQAIPGELYEAGIIDGTSSWQRFVYITLPMLWPTVTINVLLAVIGSLQTYQIIFVTTNGQFNTNTLALFIFQKAFNAGVNASRVKSAFRQGYASALSMVMFVVVFVITIITQYAMKRKGETE